MSRSHLLFPSVLVLLALASPAAADGIRYDLCTGEGDSCDNAIPGRRAQDPEGGDAPGGQPPNTVPGTCQNAKCLRAGPDEDIVYDCLRCIEVRGSGGSGGKGSSGMAGSSGSGAEESGGSAGTGAQESGGSAGSGAADSGGSGGSATSGGSGGSRTSGGAAGSGGSRSGAGCDCRTSGVMPHRSLAALLLLVGLAALARSRRQRR